MTITLNKRVHSNKYEQFSKAEENLKETFERTRHLVKGCITKVKFISEQKIKERIKQLKKKEKKELYYYKCSHCYRFHITSRKPKEPKNEN